MVKDRELPEVTIGHQSYVRATPAQPFSVVIKYNGTVGMWRVAITIDGKDTGFQKIRCDRRNTSTQQQNTCSPGLVPWRLAATIRFPGKHNLSSASNTATILT